MAGLFDFLKSPDAMQTPNFTLPAEGAGPVVTPDMMQQPQKAEGLLQGLPDQPVKMHGLDALRDKMTTPDGRGLTLSDKLFASGSILQGDTGGAATYLQNQRNQAMAQAQKDELTRQRSRMTTALRSAVDPDGNFSLPKYLDLAGADADLGEAVGLNNALNPKGTFMNAAGGLYYTNPRTGQAQQVVAPAQPKLPNGLRYDESGNVTIDPQFVQLQEQVAAAKRRGAPLAGRSGGGGANKWAGYSWDR